MKHPECEINYRDIMDLGFTESIEKDSIYEDQYGYPWSIIQYDLSSTLYLEWAKETRLCELVRLDSPKNSGESRIKKRMTLTSLTEVKNAIEFFKDDGVQK